MRNRKRGEKTRRVGVTFWFPYPENKSPVLRAHLEAHGIRYVFRRYPGWKTTRCAAGHMHRYERDQDVFLIDGLQNACRLFASIGWSCGNAKKDAAMAVWRRVLEGRALRKNPLDEA